MARSDVLSIMNTYLNKNLGDYRDVVVASAVFLGRTSLGIIDEENVGFARHILTGGYVSAMSGDEKAQRIVCENVSLAMWLFPRSHKFCRDIISSLLEVLESCRWKNSLSRLNCMLACAAASEKFTATLPVILDVTFIEKTLSEIVLERRVSFEDKLKKAFRLDVVGSKTRRSAAQQCEQIIFRPRIAYGSAEDLCLRASLGFWLGEKFSNMICPTWMRLLSVGCADEFGTFLPLDKYTDTDGGADADVRIFSRGTGSPFSDRDALAFLTQSLSSKTGRQLVTHPFSSEGRFTRFWSFMPGVNTRIEQSMPVEKVNGCVVMSSERTTNKDRFDFVSANFNFANSREIFSVKISVFQFPLSLFAYKNTTALNLDPERYGFPMRAANPPAIASKTLSIFASSFKREFIEGTRNIRYTIVLGISTETDSVVRVVHFDGHKSVYAMSFFEKSREFFSHDTRFSGKFSTQHCSHIVKDCAVIVSNLRRVALGEGRVFGFACVAFGTDTQRVSLSERKILIGSRAIFDLNTLNTV